MKFYSETLSAIFAILSGESAPKVLMLIANGEISDVPDRPDGLRRFELPASMIPRGADQRCLASGESFVEQSLSVIAASDAKCVFVFPPFIGDRWLSEEWRERFGRLGIPEILAASLVGDATSAQAHLSAERSSQVQALAMLVPSYFIASLRSSRWRQFFPAHSAVVIEHEQPIMAGAQGLPVPTLVHFSTVVFRRQPGPIRFFKITEAAAAQGVQQLVSVEEYTIEHIMPQNENLSPAWQADLGEKWQEVHNRYLHTLGNLTLTGYNSEYSDRPFKEKRDMKGGFAESPIRLNEGLGALEVWNEFEIQKRGERLAGVATKVWPYPTLPADTLAKYRKPVESEANACTLVDHPKLTGGVLELFQLFRGRVLALGPDVREHILKLYIAFKTDTNFTDVVPKTDYLRIMLNMDFDEVNDPKGICEDATGKGLWGNGRALVRLRTKEQLDDAIGLVKQAYRKHSSYAE